MTERTQPALVLPVSAYCVRWRLTGGAHQQPLAWRHILDYRRYVRNGFSQDGALAARLRRLTAAVVAVGFVAVASVASANHHTDCTLSGGTNGPGQLNCSLPTFFAAVGATTVRTSSFSYTPSTIFNPATCAVGTMSVNPAGQWLSIDTTVLDASSPTNFQEVQVSVDPSGLAEGVYTGSVSISLTKGSVAPQCPSSQELTGTVAVRLVITAPVSAPALSPAGVVMLAAALGAVGVLGVRSTARRRRRTPRSR